MSRVRAILWPASAIFCVCEFATLAHARLGIAGDFLQFNKMWLEFRQQVAVGLSRGCSSIWQTQRRLREAEAT
jgi:hypothetical protein